MTDPDRPKPLPARPASPPPTNGTAPVPDAASADPMPGPDPLAGEPPEEVNVAWRGAVWTARVVGRAGRAEARAAPLMLVGFREQGPAEGATVLEGRVLESTVPGRRLADLTEEALQAALERAKPPLTGGQKRPFFEDSDPTRRSGPTSEY
jgi:hypothetical protein